MSWGPQAGVVASRAPAPSVSIAHFSGDDATGARSREKLIDSRESMHDHDPRLGTPLFNANEQQ